MITVTIADTSRLQAIRADCRAMTDAMLAATLSAIGRNLIDQITGQQANHVADWRLYTAAKSARVRVEMRRSIYLQP